MRLLFAALAALLYVGPLAAQETRPVRPAAPAAFPAYSQVKPSWWKDRVFYEVYVNSFQDSDGDGKGDLKGLISRLDYIQSLGFKGLWLMPVQKTAAGQVHGYHPTDFRDIEPAYGTMADFKTLLAECKKRDIKVLFDLVVNHTSKDHPWFQASRDPASPYRSWYLWNEQGGKKNLWNPLPEAPEGPTYFARFNFQIPDLNLTNPEVTKEIQDIAKFWLKDVGVDGFRMDAIKHLVEEGNNLDSTPSSLKWLESFNAYVKSIKPDAYIVGEVFSQNWDELKRYTLAQADSVFTFPFMGAVLGAAGFGSRNSLTPLYNRLQKDYPGGDFATFLSNHDMNRSMTVLRGDMESAKVAASIHMTSPGIPFVYYGEEIGQFGDKSKGGDNGWRRPMQWDSTPKTAGFTTGTPYANRFDQGGLDRTVANQQTDPASLLNHYKALVNLRNARPELRTGGLVVMETSNPGVFAMVRYTDTQRSVVILNLTDAPVTDYGLTLWNGPFTQGIKVQGLMSPQGAVLTPPQLNATGGFDFWKPLNTLAPKSTLIIGM